jgi:site-specific DNA-adenine methylase
MKYRDIKQAIYEFYLSCRESRNESKRIFFATNNEIFRDDKSKRTEYISAMKDRTYTIRLNRIKSNQSKRMEKHGWFVEKKPSIISYRAFSKQPEIILSCRLADRNYRLIKKGDIL